MLKTDPTEVTVPFSINCIFEGAWDRHGDKAGGDTCLHREIIVLISKYCYRLDVKIDIIIQILEKNK